MARSGTGTGLAYRTSSATSPNFASAIAVSQARLWSVVQQGGAVGSSTSVEAWKHGVSLGSASAPVPANITRTINRIGKAPSTGGAFKGEIAEIIIFPRALSTSERQAVEAYLQDKYFPAPTNFNAPASGNAS